MPRPWFLTRAAEASLVEIAVWTTRTFGPRQASLYEDDLIAACRAVAAGTALTYGCREVIDDGLPDALRFTRAGQHLVVFIEQADAVVIVDVLHSRSDLPRRLADSLPEG